MWCEYLMNNQICFAFSHSYHVCRSLSNTIWIWKCNIFPLYKNAFLHDQGHCQVPQYIGPCPHNSLSFKILYMCFPLNPGSTAGKSNGQVMLWFPLEFHRVFTLDFSGFQHHSLMSFVHVLRKSMDLTACEIPPLWGTWGYTLQNIEQLKVKVFLQVM